MAELKTKPTNQSVIAFLDSIADEQKRKDSYTIVKLMQQATKAKPKLWGSSSIGFGSYHYKYASGREGDWMLVGFAPRKQNLTLYLMAGFDGYEQLLKKLGKHKLGKGCLYINKLEDVDVKALKELVKQSVAHTRR
jgi:hypothetical protein